MLLSLVKLNEEHKMKEYLFSFRISDFSRFGLDC